MLDMLRMLADATGYVLVLAVLAVGFLWVG